MAKNTFRATAFNVEGEPLHFEEVRLDANEPLIRGFQAARNRLELNFKCKPGDMICTEIREEN